MVLTILFFVKQKFNKYYHVLKHGEIRGEGGMVLFHIAILLNPQLSVTRARIK